MAIHDIGKINVPAKLLSTPRRMRDIEFSLTKKHSEVRREMLRDIDSSASISSQVSQVKVPILSLKGCQIARLVHYRLFVLALASEAISSTIRGERVLSSSSTPNHNQRIPCAVSVLGICLYQQESWAILRSLKGSAFWSSNPPDFYQMIPNEPRI